MATKKDFEVGQEVWFILGYHRAELTSGSVTKIGSKYITVNNNLQFNIDNLEEKVNYGAPGRLYLKEEDYLNEKELQRNIIDIGMFFSNFRDPKITLEQSRKILDILNNK